MFVVAERVARKHKYVRRDITGDSFTDSPLSANFGICFKNTHVLLHLPIFIPIINKLMFMYKHGRNKVCASDFYNNVEHVKIRSSIS